jgi:hypothetical protein
MVLVSTILLLFIIVMFILVYQHSLKKTSLKTKTVNQLYQMRNEASIKYKQAKEMRLYGVMGHRAQVMDMIDKELNEQALQQQKQQDILLEDTVKLNSLFKPLR